jgi:hypothetical protein
VCTLQARVVLDSYTHVYHQVLLAGLLQRDVCGLGLQSLAVPASAVVNKVKQFVAAAVLAYVEAVVLLAGYV